jgi:hypothetical protein
MGLLATALTCLAMAPGCGGPPPADAPAPAPFAIHFEKNGGLKPAPEELTIRPDRHAVASLTVAQLGNRTVHFRVSKKKVATLRRGLRRAHFLTLSSSPPGNCADCFLYTIQYRGHEVTIDESTLPADLRDVVTKLETIVFVHVVMPSPDEVPHRPFH